MAEFTGTRANNALPANAVARLSLSVPGDPPKASPREAWEENHFQAPFADGGRGTKAGARL